MKKILLVCRNAQTGLGRVIVEDMDRNKINFDLIEDSTYEYTTLWGWLGRVIRHIAKRLSRRSALGKEIENIVQSGSYSEVLLVKCTTMKKTDIKAIKKANVLVTVFYPDMDPRQDGYEYLKFLSMADLLIHHKPNLHKLFKGINDNSISLKWQLNYLPEERIGLCEPCDPEIGIVFIGNFSPRKKLYIAQVMKNRPENYTIIGRGWDYLKQEAAKYNFKVNVYGEHYSSRVISFAKKAKCCLGLLQEYIIGDVDSDQLTGRSVWVPCWGGLLLHPRNQGSLSLFGEAEFLYSSVDELINIINSLDDQEYRQRLIYMQQRAISSNTISIQSFLNY